MRKSSLVMVSLFILFICAAVLWQWGAYSKKTDQTFDRPDVEVSQDITVTVDQAGLEIKQVFKNLQNGVSYGTVIPKDAADFFCVDSKGAPCELAENQQSVKAKGNIFIFEYKLKNKSEDTGFMILDWLVQLSDMELSNTRIEIVDKLNKTGTWVTGLPLKGYRKMDLVNYYVFEGEGENPSLYWQKKILGNAAGQSGIRYYSAAEGEYGVYQFDRLKLLAENNHVSVIVADEKQIVHGNGIMLIPTGLAAKELEQQLAISFFSQRFHSLEASEIWILEAMASLITNEPPIKAKSQLLNKELKSKLTQAEITHFTNILSAGRSPLDHARLDGLLSETIKMRTNFFVLNRHEESSSPLLFMENRKVIVNGVIAEDLEIIVENEIRLFPFIKTMASLGYETENVGAVMNVTSDSNNYYINLKNKTFIQNGKSFGLLEDPFRKINDIVYIEGKWLTGIFDVIIEENEKEIRLSLPFKE